MSVGAIAAGVTAAAAVAGTVVSATKKSGASNAANAATQAGTQQSAADQLRMYNLSAAEQQNAMRLINDYLASAQKQITTNQQPYSDIGTAALGGINYGMGINTLGPPPTRNTGVVPQQLLDAQKAANAEREAYNQRYEAARLSNGATQLPDQAEATAIDNRQKAANTAVMNAQRNVESEADFQKRLNDYNQQVATQKLDPAFGAAKSTYTGTSGEKMPKYTPTSLDTINNSANVQFAKQQGVQLPSNVSQPTWDSSKNPIVPTWDSSKNPIVPIWDESKNPVAPTWNPLTGQDVLNSPEAQALALKGIELPSNMSMPTWTPTTIEDMKKDPGYQFRLNQGTETVQNSAATRGSLLGGNTLRALSEYGQDYASNEFGNVDTRRNQDFSNRSGTYKDAANMINNLTNNASVNNNLNFSNNMTTFNALSAQQQNDFINKMASYGALTDQQQRDFTNQLLTYGELTNQQQRDFDNSLTLYNNSVSTLNNYANTANDQNSQTFNNQTASYLNSLNEYNQNRDNPYNKFMQLLNVGQQANATINDATQNYYTGLANTAGNYANNMTGLNSQLAGYQTQNNNISSNAASDNAINQGNIKSGMANSIANSIGTLASSYDGGGWSFGGSSGSGSSGSSGSYSQGANNNLNNQVSNSLQGWSTNLFK